MIRLFRSRRITCRHPSVCRVTPGPDTLMCAAHAADEALPNTGDLPLWNLDRPVNERRVPGWPTTRGAKRNG